MGIADRAKKDEHCENVVESYKLKLQSAQKVCLKGAGAGRKHKTTEKIKSKLINMGIEILDIGLKTGVIGFLRGNKEGPTIALRADIDALPIQELNEVAYKSKVDGVMHACGHDIHTSSVMGAAMILSDIRDNLKGNVIFIFQPRAGFYYGLRGSIQVVPDRPGRAAGLHL